jgi:nucleoside-diphosphate-sugar epimerase
MRILVTGAAGHIGSALVRALAERPGGERIVATDLADPGIDSPRVLRLAADLTDARLARSLVAPDAGIVFHLASLVSGGAERDFEAGMRINLDATRDLLEACRLAGHCPKFVFTSSIAVYGGDLPDPVTDDTPPAPRISYGAQKLACEILINDYSRRGYVDGRSLRLPGVMVRPGTPNTAVSGWISAVVREPLAGRDYVCPVRPDTRVPCISVGRVVQCLLHAAELPAAALGANRTVLLTGIGASAEEMWHAARRAADGRRLGHVSFHPDGAIQAVFDSGSHATRSARAAALGFPRSRSIDEIVAEYLASLTP